MTNNGNKAQAGLFVQESHVDHTSRISNTKIGFLSWQQRAESIKKLVDEGFVDKIFMSHDWYFGISMAASGAMDVMDKMNPDGMLLISRKTIPYLKQLGVSEMTVPHPRRHCAAYFM